MRTRYTVVPVVLLCLLILCSSVAGVIAGWKYNDGPPDPVNRNVPVSLNDFRYGLLYITRAAVKSGSYTKANITQLGDLDIRADLTLLPNTNSIVVVEVTFYNNTTASYYYDKTETVSSSNDRIDYTVSGIAKKDEIPAHSFKTIELTFRYTGNDTSASSALKDLHFSFVVDKESIGDLVAQTAVDRFRDILNNDAFDGSYQTLENAMNNRSGFNKASAVTYIGNVSGSSNADSQVVESLFGQEFMSMDLDGDGSAEPITMMIKRENLDGNTQTGDDYTYAYSSWGGNRQETVEGVEMTLYITSKDLGNVSNGQAIVVYAASFTKLPDADVWTDLVPLTKGTADANNYGGYGSANSFNTDTWLSDTGKSMKELARQ